MKTETLKLSHICSNTINGNGQDTIRKLPKLVILQDFINDVALAHIQENTGLTFIKMNWAYEAQPTDSNQIVRLFLTYNYKTQYHDNANNHNTLFLKSDHHVGFKVDSICYDCIKHNNIVTNGIDATDRLSC